MKQTQFPCPSCGAAVQFDPATQQLLCAHCGHHGQILPDDRLVEELDYLAHLQQLEAKAPEYKAQVVHCDACGAETTLPDRISAARCPFCDSPIVTRAQQVRQILPMSLLPFGVSRRQAKAAYRKWLAGLWFAPSRLKKDALIEDRLGGIYLPFWTYDSDTFSDYTGQRGDDYTVTEYYTAYVDGKAVQRSRQVTRTRWWLVAGQVRVSFDDVLVPAAKSLPGELIEALEPWDLARLTTIKPDYQAGFITRRHDVDLKQGFDLAQGKMAPAIRAAVRDDIGGDHQRIFTLDTRYSQITFKHLLLPVWLASYRYRGRVYRFVVNARTGEVQGQRPWSGWKITSAVLAVLLTALLVGILLWQLVK